MSHWSVESHNAAVSPSRRDVRGSLGKAKPIALLTAAEKLSSLSSPLRSIMPRSSISLSAIVSPCALEPSGRAASALWKTGSDILPLVFFIEEHRFHYQRPHHPIAQRKCQRFAHARTAVLDQRHGNRPVQRRAEIAR